MSQAFSCYVLLDNLFAAGAVTGSGWARSPSNLLIEDIKQHPARWTGAGIARFRVTLARRQPVSAFVLVGHTLVQEARWRPTFFSDLAGTEPTGPAPVWWFADQRRHATEALAIEATNWLRGGATDAEWRAYTNSLFLLPPDPVAAWVVDVEIDNLGQPFDLGFGFASDAFRPEWNYAFGRILDAELLDLVDTTPGGWDLVDERGARRMMTLTFSDLTKAEAMRLFDAGMTNRRKRPVIVIPDPTDELNRGREVFAGTFSGFPKVTEQQGQDRLLYSVTLTAKEMIG